MTNRRSSLYEQGAIKFNLEKIEKAEFFWRFPVTPTDSQSTKPQSPRHDLNISHRYSPFKTYVDRKYVRIIVYLF